MKLLNVVLSVLVSLVAMNAVAQTGSYPVKTVKIIISFPPGGTLDTVGRMLAQKLTEQIRFCGPYPRFGQL